LPGQLQVIQDWTHLSLISGACGAGVLAAEALFDIFVERTCGCVQHLFCLEEVAAVAVVLPSLLYILKMIGQYDDQVQKRQEIVEKRKEELAKSYNVLILSMDDLLSKAAESSAMLAERSFESKRRDFQRFLERAEQKYKASKAEGQTDNDMLLVQFRRFVRRWLTVFEECSVDPVGCPRRVVTEDELERCANVGELAVLTAERLKATEVRFVSTQRDKDRTMLQGLRENGVTLLKRVRKQAKALDNREANDLELSSQSFMHMHEASDPALQKPVAAPNPGCCTCCGCNWLAYGCFGCGCSREDDGFPRTMRCICVRLLLLSANHTALFFAFVCGWPIVGQEVFHSDTRIYVVVSWMLYQIGLAMLLMRFEQIDVIQKLEKEVRALAEESDRIRVRREQMNQFWSSLQELTDLWLHRTVPRLDLMKEVQGHMEDAPGADILPLMAGASSRLEELEGYLGPLELWRTHGKLSGESKKAFGDRITALCHEETLPQVLHGLQVVIEEGILRVEDAKAASGGAPVGPALVLGTQSFRG